MVLTNIMWYVGEGGWLLFLSVYTYLIHLQFPCYCVIEVEPRPRLLTKPFLYMSYVSYFSVSLSLQNFYFPWYYINDVTLNSNLWRTVDDFWCNNTWVYRSGRDAPSEHVHPLFTSGCITISSGRWYYHHKRYRDIIGLQRHYGNRKIFYDLIDGES